MEKAPLTLGITVVATSPKVLLSMRIAPTSWDAQPFCRPGLIENAIGV